MTATTRPDAQARDGETAEHRALEEIVRGPTHDRQRDEFRDERCRAQQARQPGFDARLEIGHHHHGNERPRGIGPDQNERAEGEAPANLFDGEDGVVGGFYGDLLTVVGGGDSP